MTLESNNRRPRVLSGVQPSGMLHLGNYLGAIRQWVEQQDGRESFFCIVDMHALTTLPEPDVLRRQTREVAALYLAAGLDPRKSTIFVQSHVRAHAEGCWILNCLTPFGQLERMTQFKVKAAQRESVSAGLLDYPVLQAADILLYDADEVPVGEDQKQHVELARNIAERFNRQYGETFRLPQATVPASGARIRALNDPTKKMNKAEAHIRGHAIRLLDGPDEIRFVIKKAKMDPGKEVKFSGDPEKAGVNNLLEIYQSLRQQSCPAIEDHFAGKGYADLKREVAELVIEALRPIRERYETLIADLTELDAILEGGAERARSVAEPKIEAIKRKVGFVVPLTKI